MEGAGNWLGLLKWSLAQTSDGTVPSEITPMTEEDKKWLEQVMRECVKDEPKRMNEIMGIFVKMLEEGLTEDKSEEVIELLDELQFMVEQVDMAGVFAKFGGFQCLLGLVESENLTAEARAMAGSTLAALSQNNLEVQEIVFKSGMLDRLAKVYIKSESVLLCNKVLYAISCSIRNHAAAEEYFVLHFAEATLPKAIAAASLVDSNSEAAAGTEALTSRALFLCNALVMSDFTNHARVQKLSALVLPVCLEYLKHESINLRETTQNLLTAIEKHKGPDHAPLMIM
uniref:Nucleotide exchange factor Fes1 domain-containing protein n=1 Tax=Spumella elongata TaxID=89044 RepID=A0A7S3GSH5_9STRA|mmetsp:Transcript_17268/g.30123  ORF Transcript_17268/g.30123 Transcript_17268/m.30123 type:complete len:285 (+) Transcript_17268:48-902(+)